MNLLFLSIIDGDVGMVSADFLSALRHTDIVLDAIKRDGGSPTGYVEAFQRDEAPPPLLGCPVCRQGDAITVARPGFASAEVPLFAVRCRRCGYSTVEKSSIEDARAEWQHNVRAAA